MCLYHFLYFSSCQHGELSLITYCDKAQTFNLAARYVKIIGASILANKHRDSFSQRGFGVGLHHNNQQRTSSLSSPTPASSSASNHNASHSRNQQQQHLTMATLSPSKAHATPGCRTTTMDHDRTSSHRAALTPRSVLPEACSSISSHMSLHPASPSVVQFFDALSGNHGLDDVSSTIVGSFQKGKLNSLCP